MPAIIPTTIPAVAVWPSPISWASGISSSAVMKSMAPAAKDRATARRLGDTLPTAAPRGRPDPHGKPGKGR